MPQKRSVKRHPVTQPLDKPYRFISLTQGQNAIVDAEDFEWLSQFHWYASYNDSTKTFYARRDHFSRARHSYTWMHRVILGCSSAETGDHIDGNTLDNRRSNLRKCTYAENTRNRKKQCGTLSRFKGVHRRADTGKWEAGLNVDGKRITIGQFQTEEAAARAYDQGARKHFGAFARLNFPAVPA